MSIIPELERELVSAATRQAGARGRGRRRRWGARRPSLATAVATLVTVIVAGAALTLVGGRSTSVPGAGHHAASPGRLTARTVAGAALGDSLTSVLARLAPLLGRPSGRFTTGLCRFQSTVVWTGLATPVAMGHSGGLTLYVRAGRLVGYVYGLPAGGPGALVVRDGPRLATARGLTVGDTVARARQLYGSAFRTGTQAQGTPPDPRLGRLPVWSLALPGGRLSGARGISPGSAAQWLTTISAGATANLPCR